MASRHCVRCGKELEDAASMERGIGPICAKQDTYLFAATIPHNIDEANHVFQVVDVADLPGATLGTLAAVEEDLQVPKDDWRKTVKRIEWMLSFPDVKHNAQVALRGVVSALGYVGVVSMWMGHASSGKATVWALNGRLFVQGVKNKHFRSAFKQLPGWKFHGKYTPSKKADGTDAPNSWSVPMSEWDKFRLVIIKHYPNNTGLDSAISVAKLASSIVVPPVLAPVVAPPVVEPPPLPVGEDEAAMEYVSGPNIPVAPFSLNPPKFYAEWVEDGQAVCIHTTYKPAYVAEIKKLVPYKCLKFDWDTKGWNVKKPYTSAALNLAKKYFPELVFMQKPEPASEAKPSSMPF